MATNNLRATKVYRGGSTARHLYLETQRVELSLSEGGDAIQLGFSMDSKGGGTTVVKIDLGPIDFAHVLRAMVEADRQAAMVVMAAELAKQTAEQPKHDASIVTSARAAVRRAANDKYLAAPAGNDETELFIERQVEKLIAEIEAEEALKEQASETSNDEAA